MNKEEIINELKYWINFEAIQINKIEVINIINLIKDIEQQNKKYKEVIDKVRKLIKKHYFNVSDDYYDYFTEGVCLQDGDYDELEDILKEVE